MELDPKGLSRDVELKYTSQKIAPTAGAVGLLRYETESGYSILVTARDVAGDPLPFGADVSDEQQRSVGYIGQVGEGLLRVNNPKGQLEVKWGKGPENVAGLTISCPPYRLGMNRTIAAWR